MRCRRGGRSLGSRDHDVIPVRVLCVFAKSFVHIRGSAGRMRGDFEVEGQKILRLSCVCFPGMAPFEFARHDKGDKGHLGLSAGACFVA